MTFVFSVWVISLDITFSSFIHLPGKFMISFFFTAGCHCAYASHFPSPLSGEGCLCCFCFLAIVYRAAVNRAEQIHVFRVEC